MFLDFTPLYLIQRLPSLLLYNLVEYLLDFIYLQLITSSAVLKNITLVRTEGPLICILSFWCILVQFVNIINPRGNALFQAAKYVRIIGTNSFHPTRYLVRIGYVSDQELLREFDPSNEWLLVRHLTAEPPRPNRDDLSTSIQKTFYIYLVLAHLLPNSSKVKRAYHVWIGGQLITQNNYTGHET